MIVPMINTVIFVWLQIKMNGIKKKKTKKKRKKVARPVCNSCKTFLSTADLLCHNLLCEKEHQTSSESNCEEGFLVEGQYDPSVVIETDKPSGDVVLYSTMSDYIYTNQEVFTYRVLHADSIPFSLLTIQQQKLLCNKINLPFFGYPFRRSIPRSTLSRPSESYFVQGDGDCFFSSVSVCISGSVGNSDFLRANVCSLIASNTLCSDLFFPHTNSAEYLKSSGMEKRGTYASDVEIKATCELLGVEIIIFTDLTHQWLCYSPELLPGNVLPALFLHHCSLSPLHPCNHFQPILDVHCEQLSTDLQITNKTIIRKSHESVAPAVFSDVNVDFVKANHIELRDDRQPSKELISKFSSNSCAPNDLLNLNAGPKKDDLQVCRKCYRISTECYPLQLNPCETVNFRKVFGMYIRPGDLICNQCASFIAQKTYSWKFGWPSVICSFLRDSSKSNILLKILPATLKCSWKLLIDDLNLDSQSDPFEFSDITQDMTEFHMLISNYKAKDLVTAFNKFWMPNVRCFAGCFEFISRVGSVSFAHVLNHFFPNFVSFNASSSKYLRGLRPDFFEPFTFLNIFICKPSLFVEAEGSLLLATCSKHSGGSSLHYVHVPRNPAIGILCHSKSDRFAPLTPTLRTVKPCKIGSRSHTFSMVELSGGFSGVSSISLRDNKSLKVNSPNLIPSVEALICFNRHDVPCLLNQLLLENKIDRHFMQSLLDASLLPPAQKMADCLKSSTVFSMPSLLSLKKQIEQQCVVRACDADTLLQMHWADCFGANPKLASIVILKDDPGLFVFLQLVNNVDYLWRVLSSKVFLKKIIIRLNALASLKRKETKQLKLQDGKLALQNYIELTFPKQSLSSVFFLLHNVGLCWVVNCAIRRIDLSVFHTEYDNLSFLFVSTAKTSRFPPLAEQIKTNRHTFELVVLASLHSDFFLCSTGMVETFQAGGNMKAIIFSLSMIAHPLTS